jgi:exopolysaccharide biosynthesis protein
VRFGRRPVALLGMMVLAALAQGCARVQRTRVRPYPAVIYSFEKRKNPPQEIYVARIDLNDPNVSARVSRGGDDPDGEGKWQTTLMQPTRIADREGFDVVINGDFFQHLSGKDAEGAAALKEFKSGIPAIAIGPAETDGKLWATTQKARPAFMVDEKGRPAITVCRIPPDSARQVIAGSDILVKGGKSVAPEAEKPGFIKGPHPRTAVGIANGGKTLLLVVIDGRRKNEAVGMSLRETAEVMLEQGAEEAVNLDGGGSSVLAIRDPDSGKMHIMNHPSDGQERAVANVLGVRVKAGAH